MANSNSNSNNSNQSHQNQGGKQGGSNSERGFAAMDSDRQREIAAEGGRAAHASGNAHEFDSKEAREAGAKSHGGNSGSGNQGGSSGSSNRSSSDSGTNRGGSSEQHARAGSQSHKNDR